MHASAHPCRLPGDDHGAQDALAEAREKKRKEMEERREKVAAAEKERKKASKLLRKRTRHGQPVMRVRMDKILGQLQAEID